MSGYFWNYFDRQDVQGAIVDEFATLGKSRLRTQAVQVQVDLWLVCLRLECFCFGSTGLSCMPKPWPGGVVSALGGCSMFYGLG